jgi:hypothetical protein
VGQVNMDTSEKGKSFLLRTEPHFLGCLACRLGTIPLRQDWQTDSMHAKNGTWHSLNVPILFLFLLPTQNLYIVKKVCVCVCVCIHTHTYLYIHISDCKKTVHEVPLLPNNTASQTFLHKSREVRRVDQIFIIQAPAWWQLGEYVTLDRAFYNPRNK